MKKLFVVLAFVLASCLLFSACGEIKIPAPTPVAATTGTPAPTPVATTGPTDGKGVFDYEKIDEVRAYLQEYYSLEIEEAERCRVKIGDTEYYLDTSKIIEMDNWPEFPLFRVRENNSPPEYLGATGYAFQVFGDYIYIESDILQEGPQDGTLTRIINLKDLSVTQAERDMNIFIPKQGNKVFYTYDCSNYIFISDASLKHPKEVHVKLPDEDTIEKKIKLSSNALLIDYISVYIGITDVKDGWIYFYYSQFVYDVDTLYEGNYRINTDGSKIEKTDEGKFGDDN